MEYYYRARDNYGKIVKGLMSAESEEQLAYALRARGYYLVRAYPNHTRISEIRFERIGRKDLIVFTSQLAAIFANGVPLAQGLESLEEQVKKAKFKRVIAELRRDVQAGSSMSDSLARHPKVFPEIYVEMVRAGEATGRVDKALEDIVAFLEWQEEIANQLKGALTYPMIVLVLLGVLATILVTFTVPRFAQVYKQLSDQFQMPLPTRMLIGFSDLTRANWPFIFALVAGAWLGYRGYVRTERGRLRADMLKLRIPIIGEVIKKVELARFAAYLATLYDAGIGMVQSLEIVERVLSNSYLAAVVRSVRGQIMSGSSLSGAFRGYAILPPLVVQMIAIGETAGAMSKSLRDVAKFYDREVRAGVRTLFTYLGPILVFMLAGIFLIMALAFYLPLFEMLQAVQQAPGGQ